MRYIHLRFAYFFSLTMGIIFVFSYHLAPILMVGPITVPVGIGERHFVFGFSVCGHIL